MGISGTVRLPWGRKRMTSTMQAGSRIQLNFFMCHLGLKGELEAPGSQGEVTPSYMVSSTDLHWMLRSGNVNKVV
jgi:hypothetical protein